METALVDGISESYLQRISTRKIWEDVVHLGIDQLSPSSVPWMAKDLGEHVCEFLYGPIYLDVLNTKYNLEYFIVFSLLVYIFLILKADSDLHAEIRDSQCSSGLPGQSDYDIHFIDANDRHFL